MGDVYVADGYGMDLDTLLYKWLEPATGHKEEANIQVTQKINRQRLFTSN